MAHSKRMENSHYPDLATYDPKTKSSGIKYSDLFKSLEINNNKSSKYKEKIINIKNKPWEILNILSKSSQEKNPLIEEKCKLLLEKTTFIQKTSEKMEVLNLLLQLLEQCSHMFVAGDIHLELSQSADLCLQEAYIDNENDYQSKNELTRLKEKGYIRITEGSSYIAKISDKSAHIRPAIPLMIDIISIREVKCYISKKIDMYNKETITPWVEEIESLSKLIEDAKINRENTPPKEIRTTIGFGKSTSESGHEDVEQSLSDDCPSEEDTLTL